MSNFDLGLGLVIIAGFMVVNALYLITLTGKPRQPYTSGAVAAGVVASAIWSVWLALTAARLFH